MAKTLDSCTLVSRAPASFSQNLWLDSSVTGNGRIGAATLGAYGHDAILINHIDLKHKGHTGVLHDVSDKYPSIRKFYNDGKVLEAAAVLEKEFEKRNYKPAPDQPLPLGIINLEFAQCGKVTDYRRVTDMQSAQVTTSFRCDATTYTRRLFVARNSDVVAYHVGKSGPDKISVKVSIDGIKPEGGYIQYAKRSATTEYGIAARIIETSDSVTIFAKCFVGGSKDAELKKLKTELGEIKMSYDKLQAQNAATHKKLWGEGVLELTSNSGPADMSSLIARAGDGELQAALIERLWNFSKYLGICCNGGMYGGHGLWCSNSDATNGHLSMANVAHLLYGGQNTDGVFRLFEYFEKYIDDLKKNAARVYGSRGYFVPNVISGGSALFGSVDAKTLHFVAGGAILANLFYGYFLQTQDVKMLKSKIFPFMKEVFNFYSDILKLDQKGFYSTIPSYSPFSTPGNKIGGKSLENFGFATNATIDFLSFGALLDNLIHASGALESTQNVDVWKEMKGKLPPFSVADTGALREYTNSAFIDGVGSGCMQAYGLYPFKTFSFNDEIVKYRPAVGTAGEQPISLTEASARAALNRMAAQGSFQSVSALAMMCLQLVHAKSPEAEGALARLVASCFTPSGLSLSNDWRGSGWTSAATCDLDISGGMGFAAAITECIVQSNAVAMRILPVMISGLEHGSISEIVADFGAKISVVWDAKKGSCVVRIEPKVNAKVDISINKLFKKIKDKSMKLDETNTIRGVELTAGKLLTITVE